MRLAAAKMLDLIASLPGGRGGQTDVVRANAQALLKGIKTWTRLPKDRWPPGWKGMRGPVAPLRLVIYGHPDF